MAVTTRVAIHTSLAVTALAASLGCGSTAGAEHPAAQAGSPAVGSTPSDSPADESPADDLPADDLPAGGSPADVEAGASGSAGSLPKTEQTPRRDSSDPAKTPGSEDAEPDLVTQAVERDSLYYYVTYCNNGAGNSDSTFTVELTNTNSGESFTTNPLYPFPVPAPGACATTGGVTCGLIGDPTCSLPIAVEAAVDSEDAVVESDELDNTMTVKF